MKIILGSGMEGHEKKEGKYPGFEDYEVESAVDTLMRAAEIKADPELMKAVSVCLAKKEKAIRSISDLKSAAKKVNSGLGKNKQEPAMEEAESEDEGE
jgi:hypothetical protein